MRVIAATHRDLAERVAEGRFREDLLYRLRVVPIHMPPLRERPEDLPILVEHFLERYAPELARGPVVLASTALDRLAAYDWPGNVRELENAIKRALVLASSEVLTPEDFLFLERRAEPDVEGPDLETLLRKETQRALAEPEPEVYRRILPRVERAILSAVLAETGGNQIRAAALLGINRNTLRKKVADLGIELPGRP